MKHLPKHLRPRYRYLAVEVETTPHAGFDRGAFQRHLWYAAQNLLGDVGSAELDLRVLGFERDGPEARLVVRCRRGEADRARAVVACLPSVEGDPTRPVVRGVSGTVRACEEKYLSRPRGVSEERTVAFADADRRARFRDGRVDVRVGEGVVGATNLDIKD
jgi:ribonuclease P/MRP protein subunit POP5